MPCKSHLSMLSPISLPSQVGLGLARPLGAAVASSRFSTSSKLTVKASSSLRQVPRMIPMKPEENLKGLNERRSLRPVSPHLTIYKYPINMWMSGMNRGTGLVASLGLYGAGLAYLALPLLGVDVTHLTPSLVGLVSGLSLWFKLTAKTALAFPIVYHSVNGVRHLVWDNVNLFSMKSANSSGVVVAVVSATLTAAVAAYGTIL
ncbi:hypothetical protein FA10DRAFT_81892 [Acaromyces ingoldii]|uniref:Cytochrome b560 subunit of succinate dehydrogenase n=1 Tax=Acaromyces ingoldii TaxID=215250 RepID=A0A316YS37_9BASI|nr:hypothetical protein FA10DRAFT_81892 [Acaromyces ingoldii]PWN92051.1 hypothetical protein FA10DRAFT_81892 [Acaromyces ingoldii]